MRQSTISALRGAALGIMGGAAAVTLVGARRKRRLLGGELPREVLHRRAGEMEYQTVADGLRRAVLWGDPERGPYAAFTRFDPGVRHPLHKHSSDISLLVLEGAYVYETEEGVRRVGERECIFLPAGDIHKSGGDDAKGCLFFEVGAGPFDLLVVE